MIPLVLLVGFLGAGKTHFLTELIPELRSRSLRPRVILNDFENATIDAARLEKLAALVTPLNGECVCCGSLTELMDTLYAVRGEPGDVLLIEANGATVADELLGYLTMDRQLGQFTLPLQLTVVDASRWQRRWWHNRLEADQTRTATHLLLNWTARLSPARMTAVTSSLQDVNAGAQHTTPMAFAQTLADIVAETRGQTRRTALSITDASSVAPSHADTHTHTHAHPFASATLPLPARVVKSEFMQFARDLPKSVVRAKGFVRFAESPHEMFVWNRVGGRKTVQLDASAAHADSQPTALFIGVGMRMEEIAERVRRLTNC